MADTEPETLEKALTVRAWTDPAFRELLEHDATAALRSLHVTVPDHINIVVKVQRPDTLYYMIPPLAQPGQDTTRPMERTDLWQSGELFLWILPEAIKVNLLQMRQMFRAAVRVA